MRSDLHGNNAQVNQAHKTFQQAAAENITVFASAGDSGSDNGAGFANYAFPAADPYVTSVGGTNLLTNPDGSYNHETVWGDYFTCPAEFYGQDCTTADYEPIGATGGAVSLRDGKKGADVSYNASVYTGVLTYLGFLGPDASGFYFFGGTSAGSPQWAAVVADVDQAIGHDLGFLNPQLPDLAPALHDVTEGSNATPTYTAGFSATTGKDLPTGYGSPDVGALIGLLQP